MDDLSGLWVRLPLLAFFLILSSLGSAAVPGLNGFVGEFPILIASFSRNPQATALAALGMVLGAYYLLLMLRRVVFGPLKEPGGHEHEHAGPDHHGTAPVQAHAVPPVRWHEIAGLAPLMVLIVAIGVYPRPIFARIGPDVERIAALFPADRPQPAPVAPMTASTEQDSAR